MSKNATQAPNDVVLVYTTWPDARAAETAGAAAVTRRLAACANLMAPMRSVFWWKDQLDRADETPMLLKTTRARAEALKDFLVSEHPYDTPAILALEVMASGSHVPFLEWVAAETQPAEG